MKMLNKKTLEVALFEYKTRIASENKIYGNEESEDYSLIEALNQERPQFSELTQQELNFFTTDVGENPQDSDIKTGAIALELVSRIKNYDYFESNPEVFREFKGLTKKIYKKNFLMTTEFSM